MMMTAYRFGLTNLVLVALATLSYLRPQALEEESKPVTKLHAMQSSTSGYEAVKSFADVKLLASQLAKAEHEPRETLPEPLANMPYDEYRHIEFRHSKAQWWEEGPFSFETFHRGFVQRDKVRIFTVNPTGTIERPFSKSDFSYEEPIDEAAIPSDLGHAGLKVVSDIEGVVDSEELLTFLGASYFRGRSVETLYGTSARGLAVNVGLPAEEEFPFFKAFWVVQPSVESRQLTIWALLDSPSVAGAYEFKFEPGAAESTMHVDCELFMRTDVEKLALAPLTSMWMWGDGLKGPPKDLRPSVHDSDGLLIRRDVTDQPKQAEWVWRAFARQSYPSVSRIAVDKLKGFGLLQRNRAFYHYDDHNAKYHLRPSVWITPEGDWNGGAIELIEFPGAHEGIDNIAAYWLPHDLPRSGDQLSFSYDVSFFPGDHKEETELARATNLSLKRDPKEKTIELTVRFSGKALQDRCGSEVIKPIAKSIRGEVLDVEAEQTETGDWIATLKVRPAEDAPVELSLQLEDPYRTLTEEFNYLCPPSEPEFVYPAVYTRQE